MNCNITWKYSDTYGTLCDTTKVGKYFKTQRGNSLQFIGPRIFNALPRKLRDCKDSPEIFKSILNDFLRKIPDNPAIDKLVPEPCNLHSAQPSNGLIQWISNLGLTERRGNSA